MELKKDMYDVFGNRRPVEDLSEEERKQQIKYCNYQLVQLRESLKVASTHRRAINNDINGGTFAAGSPEAIKLQIESFERYLLELTKPERTKEMFDVLDELGKN